MQKKGYHTKSDLGLGREKGKRAKVHGVHNGRGRRMGEGERGVKKKKVDALRAPWGHKTERNLNVATRKRGGEMGWLTVR